MLEMISPSKFSGNAETTGFDGAETLSFEMDDPGKSHE